MNAMGSRVHAGLALLLAGCVLLVFVSPAWNLPQTTLRASRDAAARLAALAAILTAWAGILLATMCFFATRPIVLLPVSDSLIDITCTRRC